MEINNKVAVITGGTGGIGAAIVKRLLEHGIKYIAVFDLDNPNTRTVFANLELQYGKRVGFYACDVTNKVQFTENFDKVLKTYKTVDILFNNAGIGSDFNTELMIDINYKAVILGSLLFIERMGKHKGGNGGTIVNTASILGLRNLSCMPVYCSTKHAVVSFTRCLDEQYDITGVRVVAVCPGVTETPLVSDTSKGLDFTSNVMERLRELPAQSPEYVANAVVDILKKGKSGEVWVSEASKPAYAVKDVGDYENLRAYE